MAAAALGVSRVKGARVAGPLGAAAGHWAVRRSVGRQEPGAAAANRTTRHGVGWAAAGGSVQPASSAKEAAHVVRLQPLPRGFPHPPRDQGLYGGQGPTGGSACPGADRRPPELTGSRQSFQKAMGNPCEFFVDIM
ncbi:hypothetical protein P7K49_014326 [Saguinus oedipus]|uniref:Dishevelled C-terminal domain-containing protein n=1 Tax=Saguinus oedipus TaxID=9490 RepID=A0ABQ9VJ38_SAGOE|nr:hypothetical protein P7K49_014326 [Saguinus oedipus]